jgi:alpha-beta hydrolase superfamily lysophospholipase
MGNFFTSFEKSTNSLIFAPPNTNPSLFNMLKIHGVSQFVSGLDVPCLLVQPLERYRRNHTKCLVFSHGNGCDIYTMFPHINKMATELGIDIYIYDYPGYGLAKVQGKTTQPTEKGCYDNMTMVMDYVRTKHADTDIYLMGHSLGTGVVMNYVAENNWSTPVFLVSPYKSMGRILTDTSACSSLQIIDKFGTYYKLDYITCPVKIFHGTADKLIDVSHARDLYAGLQNKSLDPVLLTGRDHNNTLEAIESADILDVMAL